MFLVCFLLIFMFYFIFVSQEYKLATIECSAHKDTPQKDSINFTFPISFSLALGTVGIISNLSFYIGFSTEESIYIIYILGILAGPFIVTKWKLISWWKPVSFNEYKTSEKILLFLIIYMIWLFFYRTFAPWSDQDEVTFYGYKTKLIANGFTYKDLKDWRAGFPSFAESAYSYLYHISGTMILPKIFKLIGIIASTQLVCFLIGLFGLSRKYILLGALCFLVTPEFSYLATSMKTDNVLLLYELGGFSIFIFLYLFRSDLNANTLFKFSMFSLLLLLIAFAVKTSAIYGLATVSSFIFLILFQRGEKLALKASIFLVALSPLILWGYIQNTLDYSNPFYPLAGEWLTLLTNPEYIEGWSLESSRSRYNINLNNKFLEFFYTPVYMAMGFGTTLFDRLDLIVHPANKGASLGWGNPILAVALFMAIFWENKHVRGLFIFYLIMYTLWFLGIHYSRVFFASSAIALLMAIVSSDFQYKHKLINYMKRGLLIFLISIAIIFPFYHTLYAYFRMPNNVLASVSEAERYKSNQNYYRFLSQELSAFEFKRFPFSYEQVKKVNKYLGFRKQITVATNISGGRYVHIFFKYGKFINSKSSDSSNSECFLGTLDYKNSSHPNFRIKIIEDHGYGFWCKDDSI